MAAPFGPTSTTDEVLAGVDLSGKRALITGVSAGIGVETARALAARGAQIIGTARDLAKAQAATAHFKASRTEGGECEIVELDLASLASVRACAEALLASGKEFDLVIANAGVMAPPFGRTREGFETQFGTNHLGHFVLVNRVAPLMRAGARLVSLSSSAHIISDVDLEDPNFEHTPYERYLAYGRSKTANCLFTVAFDQRHRQRGVRATAVHPGSIPTELNRHSDPAMHQQLIERMNETRRAQGLPPNQRKTIPQGAASSVWAAVVAPAETVGSRYCENCRVADIVSDPNLLPTGPGVRPYALDRDHAEALWAKSEALVGEHF